MAPDGRSLITSISMQQSAIWIHDDNGDRAVSTQGYAVVRDESDSLPWFSSDDKRLYYLFRRDTPESPIELWRTDLTSGMSEAVIRGISIREFNISSDETQAVFSTFPAGKPSQLWLAVLDRSAPPRMITSSGEANPHFGPQGEVLFLLREGNEYYLAQIRQDGSGRSKVVPYPMRGIVNISPDRRFVISNLPVPAGKEPNGIVTMAIPVGGGPPRRICAGICPVAWSPDGKYFYAGIAPASIAHPTGKMVAIPLPPGETLPPLPESGIRWEAEGLNLPGVQFIEQGDVTPGLKPPTYAYVKSVFHANLFRIPLR